ncbi:MAG TPA: DUF6348 family protein [Longimicrobium sp.]|nr:DUF6348 family protein [Longimicrobium sp.]
MEPSALDLVEELLAAHGVRTGRYQGWLVDVEGRLLPPVRARIETATPTRDAVTARLDVEVMASARHRIGESFAGMGGDVGEAAASALENFARSSLHVLLSALWEMPDDEQVTTEEWTLDGTVYRATLGNHTIRSFGGEPVEVPAQFVDELHSLTTSLSAAEELYWVRAFYANMDESSHTVEVLLNNETWPAAQAAIAALPWERRPTFYSVRLFLILKRIG